MKLSRLIHRSTLQLSCTPSDSDRVLRVREFTQEVDVRKKMRARQIAEETLEVLMRRTADPESQQDVVEEPSVTSFAYTR